MDRLTNWLLAALFLAVVLPTVAAFAQTLTPVLVTGLVIVVAIRLASGPLGR